MTSSEPPHELLDKTPAIALVQYTDGDIEEIPFECMADAKRFQAKIPANALLSPNVWWKTIQAVDVRYAHMSLN